MYNLKSYLTSAVLVCIKTHGYLKEKLIPVGNSSPRNNECGQHYFQVTEK